MAVEVAVGYLVGYTMVVGYDAGENALNYFYVVSVFFDLDKSERIIFCGKLIAGLEHWLAKKHVR